MILVVDDDADCRALARTWLARWGYFVCEAEDVAAAFRVLECIEVDCVLSDLMMPGASGLDLARGLAAFYPRLPLVFMTGMAPGDCLDEARTRGPVVPKGFGFGAALAQALKPGKAPSSRLSGCTRGTETPSGARS